MIIEKFIISKLMHECKLFKANNTNNMLDAKFLLFITNTDISNLSV